jgi:hypothetical protein
MLVYFMDTWSNLRSFVIFYGYLVIWYIFPVLVFCTKKNLATLNHYIKHSCEGHKARVLDCSDCFFPNVEISPNLVTLLRNSVVLKRSLFCPKRPLLLRVDGLGHLAGGCAGLLRQGGPAREPEDVERVERDLGGGSRPELLDRLEASKVTRCGM